MGYTNLWLLSIDQGSVRNASVRRKSSERASAISAKHATHSDQASRVAERALIPPTPRSCSLAASVTVPLYRASVSYTLRQPLRKSKVCAISPPPRIFAPAFVAPSATIAPARTCLIGQTLNGRGLSLEKLLLPYCRQSLVVRVGRYWLLRGFQVKIEPTSGLEPL